MSWKGEVEHEKGESLLRWKKLGFVLIWGDGFLRSFVVKKDFF